MAVIALLIFAITLLVAVLFSGIAERSVLSISVLVLAAGFVSANVFGVIDVQPQNPLISKLIELAIFSVLFTDGMRFDLHEIKEVWQLPGRALLFGMPLTFGGIALLAHFLAHLSWNQSLLVGAVLSPTDPVFAAAVVKRRSIRHAATRTTGC